MKSIAALLLFVASHAGWSQDVPSYRDLVGSYRRTDVGAVDTLQAMARDWVDKSVAVALATDPTLSVPELRAAVLLHTDVAVRLLSARDIRFGGFHVQTAQRLLLRAVDLDRSQEDFMWRWHLAAIAVARHLDAPGVGQPLEALVAKKWPPRSARALYLRAVDLEVRAGQIPVGSGPSATTQAPYTNWLVAASAALEQALLQEPAFGAASLHLGRIRMLEGQRTNAARLFRAALMDVDPTVRYLSSLFLGSLEERDGRMDEAEALYRAAAKHWPHGQSATLALAELLSRVGREDEARDALAERLLSPTVQRGLEPLWVYAADRRDAVGTRLGLLRAETWQ